MSTTSSPVDQCILVNKSKQIKYIQNEPTKVVYKKHKLISHTRIMISLLITIISLDCSYLVRSVTNYVRTCKH